MTPTDRIVTFAFTPSGTVTDVRVADYWAQSIAPEDLGHHILESYVEQATQHLQAPAPGTTPDSQPLPESEAKELFAAALDIMHEARGVLEKFRASRERTGETPLPTAEEPIHVRDRSGHVAIIADGGWPTVVSLDPAWLRQGDVLALEEALKEAFARLPEGQPVHSGELGELRERHRELTQRLTDLRKG